MIVWAAWARRTWRMGVLDFMRGMRILHLGKQVFAES